MNYYFVTNNYPWEGRYLLTHEFKMRICFFMSNLELYLGVWVGGCAPDGVGVYGQIWAGNGHLRAFYFENGLG